MAKRLIEAMKQLTVEGVTKKPLRMVGSKEGQAKDEETGALIPYVKVEVEVPKGCGALSRHRFEVKIVNGKRLVTDEELDQHDFYVTFKNLQISYIDERGTVYFKAENYGIKKEG